MSLNCILLFWNAWTPRETHFILSFWCEWECNLRWWCFCSAIVYCSRVKHSRCVKTLRRDLSRLVNGNFPTEINLAWSTRYSLPFRAKHTHVSLAQPKSIRIRYTKVTQPFYTFSPGLTQRTLTEVNLLGQDG